MYCLDPVLSVWRSFVEVALEAKNCLYRLPSCLTDRTLQFQSGAGSLGKPTETNRRSSLELNRWCISYKKKQKGRVLPSKTYIPARNRLEWRGKQSWWSGKTFWTMLSSLLSHLPQCVSRVAHQDRS